MKRIILLILCLAAGFRSAPAETSTQETALATLGMDFGFPVGEKLQYRVYWGIIPVGRATITTSWENQDGRQILLIHYEAHSLHVLAALYPVNDVIECRIDPQTFLPITFTKSLNEGRYWTRERTDFDHAARKATWRSFEKDWSVSDRQEIYAIEPDTRDFITFMYYTRRTPWTPNETRSYRVMADDKIYDLIVHTRGLEKVAVGPFGDVRSLRIDPEAKFNGLFIRKGKATLWISDDTRRLCTRAEARLPMAHVWAVPDKVYGPGDDFWTRKTQARESNSVGIEKSGAAR